MKLTRNDVDAMTQEQEFEFEDQRYNELSNSRVSRKEIRTRQRKEEGEVVGNHATGKSHRKF